MAEHVPHSTRTFTLERTEEIVELQSTREQRSESLALGVSTIKFTDTRAK
jgi:hypothetical protein